MRFDLNAALSTFRLIAAHGSFTRAAAQLNVSPSALSQTLRQLESYLGVRLCNRTTRQVSLTEGGSLFLSRITPSLNALEQAIDELRQSSNLATGTLRLTLPRVVAQYLVEPALAEFMHKYPQVKLDLDINDGFRRVVADGYDAGIRLGKSLEQDMVAVPLGGVLRFVLVASPDYLAKHGHPKTPYELHQHACLCYRFMSSGAVHQWTFAELVNQTRSEKTRQTFEILPEWQLCANEHATCIQAAIDGAGLTYVFDVEVRELINSGKLESVLDNWIVPVSGFYLYYPNREYMPLKLRVFIDHMRKQVKTL